MEFVSDSEKVGSSVAWPPREAPATADTDREPVMSSPGPSRRSFHRSRWPGSAAMWHPTLTPISEDAVAVVPVLEKSVARRGQPDRLQANCRSSAKAQSYVQKEERFKRKNSMALILSAIRATPFMF